jgi:hypothetical protein
MDYKPESGYLYVLLWKAIGPAVIQGLRFFADVIFFVVMILSSPIWIVPWALYWISKKTMIDKSFGTAVVYGCCEILTLPFTIITFVFMNSAQRENLNKTYYNFGKGDYRFGAFYKWKMRVSMSALWRFATFPIRNLGCIVGIAIAVLIVAAIAVVICEEAGIDWFKPISRCTIPEPLRGGWILERATHEMMDHFVEEKSLGSSKKILDNINLRLPQNVAIMPGGGLVVVVDEGFTVRCRKDTISYAPSWNSPEKDWLEIEDWRSSYDPAHKACERAFKQSYPTLLYFYRQE